MIVCLSFLITDIPLTQINRIEVQDQVHQLQKEPQEECQLEVEQRWRALTTDLLHLQSLQSRLNHTASAEVFDDQEPSNDLFENSDNDIGEAERAPIELFEGNEPEDSLPPEHTLLHLPSCHRTTAAHPLH